VEERSPAAAAPQTDWEIAQAASMVPILTLAETGMLAPPVSVGSRGQCPFCGAFNPLCVERSRSGSLLAGPGSERGVPSAGPATSVAFVRQIDAGDIDDGLPRGFLAGAIVEVRLALHLNWA